MYLINCSARCTFVLYHTHLHTNVRLDPIEQRHKYTPGYCWPSPCCLPGELKCGYQSQATHSVYTDLITKQTSSQYPSLLFLLIHFSHLRFHIVALWIHTWAPVLCRQTITSPLNLPLNLSPFFFLSALHIFLLIITSFLFWIISFY